MFIPQLIRFSSQAYISGSACPAPGWPATRKPPPTRAAPLVDEMGRDEERCEAASTLIGTGRFPNRCIHLLIHLRRPRAKGVGAPGCRRRRRRQPRSRTIGTPLLPTLPMLPLVPALRSCEDWKRKKQEPAQENRPAGAVVGYRSWRRAGALVLLLVLPLPLPLPGPVQASCAADPVLRPTASVCGWCNVKPMCWNCCCQSMCVLTEANRRCVCVSRQPVTTTR